MACCCLAWLCSESEGDITVSHPQDGNTTMTSQPSGGFSSGDTSMQPSYVQNSAYSTSFADGGPTQGGFESSFGSGGGGLETSYPQGGGGGFETSRPDGGGGGFETSRPDGGGGNMDTSYPDGGYMESSGPQ